MNKNGHKYHWQLCWKQIVRTLEGDLSLDDLSDAGSKASQGSGLTASQVYDTTAYNADMLKFRKMVLDSGEYTSD